MRPSTILALAIVSGGAAAATAGAPPAPELKVGDMAPDFALQGPPCSGGPSASSLTPALLVMAPSMLASDVNRRCFSDWTPRARSSSAIVRNRMAVSPAARLR